MRTRIALVIFIALALCAGAIAALGIGARKPAAEEPRFGPGAFVGPVAVGGMSLGEAQQAVDEYVRRRLARLALAAGGELVAPAGRFDLGLRFAVAEGVERALAAGRRGPARLFGSLRERSVYPLNWSVDEEALDEQARVLAAAAFRPPQNALLDPETGAITRAAAGRRLDRERLAESARAAALWVLAGDDLAGAPGDARDGKARAPEELPPHVIDLPLVEIRPRVSAELLAALVEERPAFGRVLLTRYTTRFAPAEHGRTNNLMLAARLIDGTVLEPGAVFSFNEIVGPRLEETGFLPAPEIVGQNFVEGVGGGICQVSSTLYNAVLYADLRVRERYRHSVPLGYVPPGRDATLHYGVMDFRFENTLDQPIVVRAEVRAGRLTVSLWGERALGYDVELHSERSPIPVPERRIVDPALAPGERVVEAEGGEGAWIYVYKRVRRVGEVEAAAPVLVSRNYYPPDPRRVRVGPEPAGDPGRPGERGSPAGREM